MNKAINIIADYGHAKNCPGKCSPDGTLYEWKSNREIGMKVVSELRNRGYNVHETWVQDHEPLSTPGRMCGKKELNAALNWRVREVNRYCDIFGTSNCISISFHSNAAGGDGKWHDARGFCVMVGKKASAKSKKLAQSIYDEAYEAGLKGNRCVPKEHYWVQGLAMCDTTKCPAVLIEAMFYDNKEDLAYLKSEAGKKKLVEVIVNGIVKYVEAA